MGGGRGKLNKLIKCFSLCYFGGPPPPFHSVSCHCKKALANIKKSKSEDESAPEGFHFNINVGLEIRLEWLSLSCFFRGGARFVKRRTDRNTFHFIPARYSNESFCRKYLASKLSCALTALSKNQVCEVDLETMLENDS